MEEFSRRIWAPAQQGLQRETRWFYERARGQYADAQSKLTPMEQRKFKAEHPKQQMFTKTDLAKFENVWDDHPKWVNLGSQKNFARYAARIGGEWDKSSDEFNEFYFKRAIARALIFRATERIVSAQSWYNGGYRANIVAYTLALLGYITKLRNENIDFLDVWNIQKVSPALENTIAVVSKAVNDDVIRPPQGISNISEWCKKEACWARIQARAEAIANSLPAEFYAGLISLDEQTATIRSAKQTQRTDNGIETQKKVLAVSATEWARIHRSLIEKGLLTPKQDSALRVAMQIPSKFPTEKQSAALLKILEEGRLEGVAVHEG